VARGIHTLVGGEVDHATPDAAPLGDDTKMLRRLLALNLMAREGWAPDAQLWKVGDACSHVRTSHKCVSHMFTAQASHPACGFGWVPNSPQLPRIMTAEVEPTSAYTNAGSKTQHPMLGCNRLLWVLLLLLLCAGAWHKTGSH
jgi:hypothetical protein